MDNLLVKAEMFAVAAHQDRRIRLTSGYNRSQQKHIQEVADLVWAAGGTDKQIAAAWLHDVVEDTSVTIADIERAFGHEVSSLVAALTDPANFAQLPVAQRKTQQLERMREQRGAARLVKLADQTANVRLFALNPPAEMSMEDCASYVRGAKKLADLCRKESSLLFKLFSQAFDIAVERFEAAA